MDGNRVKNVNARKNISVGIGTVKYINDCRKYIAVVKCFWTHCLCIWKNGVNNKRSCHSKQQHSTASVKVIEVLCLKEEIKQTDCDI